MTAQAAAAAAAPARPGPDAAGGSVLGQNFRLNDGREMPMLGLGVYRVEPGEEAYNAVRWALEAGYRLIDTAAMYRNEADVGRAVRDSGVPRDAVWVTTKVLPADHGMRNALAAARRSNEVLGLGYIDLLLIHSPTGGKIVETWRALGAAREQGIARSIGVSNFNTHHLEALATHAPGLVPAVNQLEMHPLVFRERRPVIELCRKAGILLQAYGSLFSGQQRYLSRPEVAHPAAAHGRSPAQILLRWALQEGFAIIPKSTRRERISANAQLDGFTLTPAEMGALGQMSGRLREYWNPLTAKVDLGSLRRPTR
eukprot:TRINITY_DN71344_c0_g1_i1.p1 TRINITY_DN71344_c0_g1~~TRINITY_DN71344_c0_g1_i1.p1  ORF type:complete len:350 (+),score=117.35 TRINITY_DN71344_c0_g1_i1:116-1051(+)